MMESNAIQELSILGGPLHRLGLRLGLARGTKTVGVGVALGLFAWGITLTLSFLEGAGGNLLTLSVIAAHVRFLVVVPLFFLCETWVAPQMAEFARNIVHSGVVRQDSMAAFASIIRRTNRLSESRVAEFALLAAAIALPMIETFATLPGTTGSWASMIRLSGGRFTWMQAWYLGFCLPLFRFLIARWLWRLYLWCSFLWRVQRLPLRLIPIHSDGVGGLGYLEIVHEQFAPLALGISASLFAQCEEAISGGTMAFESLYYVVPAIALLIAALFVGPLLVFYRKLWICRATGMSEYMSMAARYVIAFESTWVRDERASGQAQLGSPDLQSLADLTNSVNVVRQMRWIPAGRRLILELAFCVAIPLLPLLLMKYPIDELALRLFQALTGL